MKQKPYHSDFDPVPSENTDEQWNMGRFIVIRLVAGAIIGMVAAVGLIIAVVSLASFCFQHQTWAILTSVAVLLCFGMWRMVKKLRRW